MANHRKGAIMPTTPTQGAASMPVVSSGISLTRSDIRTMARKAADYITFNCDGVSEGFEITHKGYTVFVDYSARLCNDEMSEFTEVPAVWDRAGRECPEIAEALQLMLN